MTQAKNSYGQALKSSSLIGGASVINMVLGAVRTKFTAVILGPTGVGLMGTYVTITNLTTTLTGLGIGFSGVRQIAEAYGTGDSRKIAGTIIAMRRTVMVLGAVGMVILALLSWQVSNFTFKSSDYVWPIAFLAVTVFMTSVSGGQTALVQGVRRIGDISRISVFAAVSNTLISIPLLLWLGMKAIVPILVANALGTSLLSWWYARKIPVERVTMTWRESWMHSRGMLKMGLAFLVTGLLTTLSAYIIRVLIVRKLGVSAAGEYQAGFALASLYAAFVLDATGTEFYPRLTAVAKDDAQCNNLVNEQSEVSLLLVGPGVLATIGLAPLLVHMFYGPRFDMAIILLRWFVLGLLLRVISWPISFILVARGLATLVIWSQILCNAVYIGLVFLCFHYFGLVGTALAFVGFYAFTIIWIALVARKLSGFTWSKKNVCYGISIVTGGLIVFGLSFVLTDVMLAVIGGAGAFAFGLFSLKRLAVSLRGTRFETYFVRFAPKWLYSFSPQG